MRVAVTVVLVGAALLAGSCGGSSDTHETLLIAVNAPFSKQSALGESIARGTELAVQQIDDSGGVFGHGTTYTFRVKRYDDGLSAQTAVANVRHAIADGAVAVVDEGTGVDASWQRAATAGVPIGIVHQGGSELVDPQARPNVFRIVPTDHGLAFRLAEYLSRRHLRPAVLYEDSQYGQAGAAALRHAYAFDPKAVTTSIEVSSDASDLSAPVLRARKSHPGALLVWGGPGTIAGAVRAARRSGWDVPIFAPPDAADPLVRQELSDHPEWLDGLTFADGRLTAEVGPGPYYAFVDAYGAAFGRQPVGVKTKTGQTVYAVPEYAMYASDFVNLLAAAVRRAGGPSDGKKLIAALDQVTVRGANGDERGFNENNHEGVVDDDVYFAVFHDMTFRPVQDDPLSSTLPALRQVP